MKTVLRQFVFCFLLAAAFVLNSLPGLSGVPVNSGSD